MFKKPYILNIVLLSSLLLMISCNQKGSIKQNLKSLDEKNYKILDSYLKHRKVVGLGEYTHGDGELFKLKTEIVEHLHKNLGFEAVLMESDFLAVEYTLPALSTHSKKEAANIGIQSTWANSKEYLSLINYLEKTAKKGDTLHFHGFDSQMTGTESINIHKAQAQLIKDNISSDVYNNLLKSLNFIKSRNTSNITLDSLKLLRESIAKISKGKNQISVKSSQWLKNIEGNLRQLILLKEAPQVTPNNFPEILSHPNYIRSGSIRDSLMFDNVEYYLKKYKKVIIWAANKHVQNKSGEKTWMGELLKKSLGDDYYSMLVLYHQGSWSYPQGEPQGVIPKPIEGTLAYEIGSVTNSEVAFLDISETQIPKMKVRTNNFMTTDSIVINNYGDGILYVRNATGSTMAEEEHKNN